jgi:hypothetical protein
MWQMRVDIVRPHTAVLRTRAEAVEWLRSQGIVPLPIRFESRPEDPLAQPDALE